MIEVTHFLAFALGIIVALAASETSDDGAADSVQALLEDRREDIQQRYVDGKLTRQQFEREVALVEDPRTEEVMYAVSDVDGVGPAVAFEIAREFPTVDDLQEASADDLESINQVGENRAGAIRRRLVGEA